MTNGRRTKSVTVPESKSALNNHIDESPETLNRSQAVPRMVSHHPKLSA